MAVKEKLLQGGGLGPVVGGEDHLPVEGEVMHACSYFTGTNMYFYSKLSPLKSAAYLSSCRQYSDHIPSVMLNTWSSLLHPLPSVRSVFLVNIAPG